MARLLLSGPEWFDVAEVNLGGTPRAFVGAIKVAVIGVDAGAEKRFAAAW
jgi:hypothetical protein